MPLKKVPPNAPSLITSIGVSIGLKSVFTILLYDYVTELCKFFNVSFLLIPINKHLKVAPFALNIAIFFKE